MIPATPASCGREGDGVGGAQVEVQRVVGLPELGEHGPSVPRVADDALLNEALAGTDPVEDRVHVRLEVIRLGLEVAHLVREVLPLGLEEVHLLGELVALGGQVGHLLGQGVLLLGELVALSAIAVFLAAMSVCLACWITP